MQDVSSNNKRIAKNTLLLYVRMLFTMSISLYTSRVVLNTLGVTDYGIYNVVGGVIALLGFLTNSMGAASSRYITYDLGKGNMEMMKRTFGNILSIHFILAGIILLVGETIGLWFVLNKLQIPNDRHVAALWVYQFSVFTSVLSVISVPYNAAIIAHERMKAFAYIGIVDAVLKLAIVYLLLVIPYDKLIINASDKLKATKENGIQVFIEDSYDTCKELLENGIKSILMTTKMNQDIRQGNIVRVKNWKEIYEEILKIEK